MKANISSTTKAHLIRGAFYVLLLLTGTLLAYFRPEAPTNVSNRMLTFAERVAYQRVIEDVYWRHRIWPKENLKHKPSLDEMMPVEQIEKKVEDYLRDSQTLETYRQKSITPEQLQAEMERMTRDTKQPEVLQELYEALGNDPFVIAECLARPVLIERSVAELLAHDKGQRFALLRAQAAASKFSIATLATATYVLPAISNPDACINDTWTATSTTNAPGARTEHSAVWTGSEMILWGGVNGIGVFNTGGRYDPSADTWTATSTTNAPSARAEHTAVWTGSEMIVWGGVDAVGVFNTGGRYNPSTDSWTATSTSNAPDARTDHTAVWTGSEMIVWGGSTISGVLNTGGRYNPSTDSWTATSTTNAPDARAFHSAVWTGSEMIVWGGMGTGTIELNTGGRYNPSTNTWTATSSTNASQARHFHTAVWIGSEMIVWGGVGTSGPLNTGGRYNPSTDSWTATSTTNAPEERTDHTAVWTGSEMIVWGGFGSVSRYLNTGGRYNPSTNTWTATSTTNAPDERDSQAAVWTGSEMIVWGGVNGSGVLNTGGRYCAAALSPTPIPTATFTPTPTPTGCSVTSSGCGSVITGTAPTDFTVNVSGAVDPASVQASDFTVNGISANSFTLINGNTTIIFHFNTSPVIPGQNTMHIAACAFNCGNGCVQEFTCRFTYKPSTPTPTPTPTAAASATPTCPPGNQYVIAQIGGSIVPCITEASVPDAGCADLGDDDNVVTIALPFSYTLYDQSFTSINLSPNGNAQFTTTDSTFINQCLPWLTHNYTIYPYWDDLYLGNPGFSIFASISGSAPNRIFNIEWRAQYFPGFGNANFELRLYEGQTRFDVIYGTVTNGNTSATAGVQKNDTTFTQYFCNGTGGAASGGQSYILTPCGTPTPTPTGTPSPTPTATATATATPTPTPTATPTATPTSTPRPSPTPRFAPTPRLHPSPPPRP